VGTYLVESPLDPTDALVAIAKEQSLSHWSGGALSEAQIIERYAAKAVRGSVRDVEAADAPTCLTFVGGITGPYRSFIGKVAYPVANFGGMFAPMCNTAIGEIHNLGTITAVRVLDLEFPPGYLDTFAGPVFGVEDLREMLGEHEGPLFIGPVKPCVGLSPREFAKAAVAVLRGGFHAVKDDELLVDPDYSRLAERVRQTVRAVREVEIETGRRKMYFAHIGGDADRMDTYYRIALAEGVDGIMVSPGINGLDVARRFRGEVPVISHNSLFYASARHASFGVAFRVWAMLQRLVGADVIVTPAKYGTFDIMEDAEHVANVAACLRPMGRCQRSLPGLSGGQSPASLARHYRQLRTADFALVVGGAAYGHPRGGEQGAQSFVEAWKAILNSEPRLAANSEG
jgi:ribulose-bisphosphate carboxylase large chain